MKKLLLIVLAISTTSLISCTEEIIDAIKGDVLLAQVVGSWGASEITTTGCDDETENGTETCPDDENCITLTINDDSTYTLSNNLEDPAVNESGTISITESTITLCESGDSNCESDNYVVSTTNLTITFSDDSSPGCTSTVVFTRQP